MTNTRARSIIDKSLKETNVAYNGDALPNAIIRNFISAFDTELQKTKWIRDDEPWNDAIIAIRKELKTYL